MKKVFLDTNIILDFLLVRGNFYESSAKILTLADYKKIEIFASPLSISNAFYIVSKYENTKIALDKIRKFKILCHISVMNEETVEKAIHSSFKDFEDAMQYYSAIAENCEVIITRNEKDFKNALIPVIDAEGFLQSFKNNFDAE